MRKTNVWVEFRWCWECDKCGYANQSDIELLTGDPVKCHMCGEWSEVNEID